MASPNARGFTLLEVAIATALLVVIALGTAQLFSIAIRQNRLARDQLTMGLLAAAKLDDLSIAAADPARRPLPGGALDRSVSGFSEIVANGGARYVRRWIVAPVPGHPDLLSVGVRVVREERAHVPSVVVDVATIATIAGALP